jgi:hypothetical protein
MGPRELAVLVSIRLGWMVMMMKEREEEEGGG